MRTSAGAALALMIGAAACVVPGPPSQGPPRAPAPSTTPIHSPGPTSAPAPGLPCLDLAGPREVVAGQPVHVLVILRNCTPFRFAMRGSLAPGGGRVTLWLQGPGERERRPWSAFVMKETRGVAEVALAPGESAAAAVAASAASDGWTMERTGRYVLQAELALDDPAEGTVTSEPLAIEVLAPGTPEGGKATALLLAHDVLRLLQEGPSATGARDAPSLEEFLRSHPKDPRAASVRFLLAWSRAPACEGPVELRDAAIAAEDPAAAWLGATALARCGHEDLARAALDGVRAPEGGWPPLHRAAAR